MSAYYSKNIVSKVAGRPAPLKFSGVPRGYKLPGTPDPVDKAGTVVSNVAPTVPPWTPANIAKIFWFDSSDLSTITKDASNFVSQWADKSGNGNHATQATSSSKPTYTVSDSLLNNKSSISSASQNGQIGLDLPSTSLQEIFVVAYYKDGLDTTFDNYNALISGPGNVGQYRIMGDKGKSNWWSTTNIFNDGGTFKNGATTSNFAVLPMPATLLRFTSSAARNETRGILYNTKSSDRGWVGGVGEIIGLSATSLTSDRQKIEGYLAHKWGLAANLPSGHAYKTKAP
jgi:hypothetical protein